jgi:hypothetical protein
VPPGDPDIELTDRREVHVDIPPRIERDPAEGKAREATAPAALTTPVGASAETRSRRIAAIRDPA